MLGDRRGRRPQPMLMQPGYRTTKSAPSRMIEHALAVLWRSFDYAHFVSFAQDDFRRDGFIL